MKKKLCRKERKQGKEKDMRDEGNGMKKDENRAKRKV